jgi:hypothetical protein
MPRPKGFEPYSNYALLEYQWTSQLYNAAGYRVGQARYGKALLSNSYLEAQWLQTHAVAGNTDLQISYDATNISTQLSGVVWYNKRQFIVPLFNSIIKKPQLLATLP